MSDLPATIRERGEGDGRSVEIRIMPWGQVAETPEGREMFERGAFASANPGRVTVKSQRHGGTLVGRGTDLVEHDDAAYLHARISETPAGDELLTLIRDGVVSEASVSFKPVRTARRRGVLVRQAVDLWRVAILERGSYPGAGVVAVRSQSEGTNVVEEIEQQPEANPPPDLGPLLERMERLDERLVQLQARAAVPPPGLVEPRFAGIGELLHATLSDMTLNRALADQISSANPGLLPKAVLTEVQGIIGRGRPTVNAFGVRALPPKGSTVTWPKLTTAMTGLIAAQSAEKAAVVSAAVSFGEGTSAIVTYAGGSDISYQLIRRSDPPYLQQYARVMLTAWATVTNAAYSAAVYAGGTGAQGWVATTDTTGAAFVTALVNASVTIETQTGQPAEFVILAPNLFAQMAAIFAQKSVNPQSVGGTATAAGLSLNVSGVPVIMETALAASTGYVSNSQASAWLEDPVGAPAQIAVDDAEKIGSNVAYWSLGSAPLFIPGAIVKFTVT